VPDLEEIRDTVKDTVKDAAKELSDVTRDAVQQLVQQSLLQLIETAKTVAEQALTGAKQTATNATDAAHHAVDSTSQLAKQYTEAASAAAHQATDAASKAAQQAIGSAEAVVAQAQPPVEKPEKKRGGFLRFVLVGLVIGAAIAFFSQRGGDDDEDFGEENWIEVKHDEAGTGPAMQESAKPATPSPTASSEPEAPPTQEELDARASDH
jgi:hypothetical protein